MKFFIAIFLFFSCRVFGLDVVLVNSSPAVVVFTIDDALNQTPVQPYSVLSISVSDSNLVSDGLLYFASYVYTVGGGYLGETSSFGEVAFPRQIFLNYSDTGSSADYSFVPIDNAPSALWSFAWQAFAIGCGCMVVPATLSMALRAVRRGLTHNVSPS